jgi:hypothetical protein
MPYKLRKAPKRDLYWVVGEDGSKKSKDPIPRKRAEAQMRALYASENQMKGGMCFGRCYRMSAKQKRDAEDEGKRHMIEMWANGTTRYDELWADTMAELAMKYPYTTEDQIEEVTNTSLKLFKDYVEFLMGRLDQRRRANEAMRVAAAEAAEEQRRDILNENSRIRASNRATIKEGNANTKRDIDKMRYRR